MVLGLSYLSFYNMLTVSNMTIIVNKFYFPRTIKNLILWFLYFLCFYIAFQKQTFANINTSKLESTETLNLSKSNKVLYTNLALSGGVLGYGFLKWDYGKNSFGFDNEGWFGQNTDDGGADKIGHAYTAYLTSRLAYPVYQKWGYNKKSAAQQAFLTSFIFTNIMEVGDGFSKTYGFSYEDFIANSAGQFLAYALQVNPTLDEKLDFRIVYNPQDGLNSDPLTDYESAKYLLATKLSGFEKTKNNILKYGEIHLGYYARGYGELNENNERNIYIGFGINIAKILEDFSFNTISNIFNYYQAPYTYIEANKKL